MTGQIDLFKQIEWEERERKSRESVREGYRRWLHAIDLSPCGPDARSDYAVYCGVIHLCDDMPDGVYMWQNEIEGIHGGQYWARQEPEASLTGTQMDVCPYCGADLCHGEGQRFLRKASGHVYGQKSYRDYYGLDEIDEQERRCSV